jgi:predicted nucleic acid-binding protein
VGIVVISGYLLDTNHVGHAVTPSSIVRQQISKLRTGGAKIGTCVPVLCEIEAGIQQVNEPDRYRSNLEYLLRQVRIWPIDKLTAQLYGVIYHDLKKRGRVLSQVDIMLAALSRQMNLALVTSDKDFSAISGLAVENWLS